jgi:hypothetical protein
MVRHIATSTAPLRSKETKHGTICIKQHKAMEIKSRVFCVIPSWKYLSVRKHFKKKIACLISPSVGFYKQINSHCATPTPAFSFTLSRFSSVLSVPLCRVPCSSPSATCSQMRAGARSSGSGEHKRPPSFHLSHKETRVS